MSRILTTKHLSWSDQTYAAAALKSVWSTWQQLLLELLTNWRPAAAADTKSSKQLEPASCKEAKTVGGGRLMCCLTEPCLDTVGGSQSSSKLQAAALRLPWQQQQFFRAAPICFCRYWISYQSFFWCSTWFIAGCFISGFQILRAQKFHEVKVPFNKDPFDIWTALV